MARTGTTTAHSATGYPQSTHIAVGYPTTSTSYPSVAPPPATFSQQANVYERPVGVGYNFKNIREKLFGGNLSSRIINITLLVLLFIFTVYTILVCFYMLVRYYPEFRVESASISSLNSTGSQLKFELDFTLFVRNPNRRLSIFYDRAEVVVFYGKFSERTLLPPFLQGGRNETRLQFQLSMFTEYEKDDLSQGISNGRKYSESSSFEVEMWTWIRFRSWVMKTYYFPMRVDCESMKIGFSSPNNGTGTLLDHPIPCIVELL